MENTPLNKIHQNIEAFTKRFYQRDLYTGLIITLSGLTGVFILFIISEYIFRFSGNLRAFLFYAFLAILFLTSIKNIFLPIAKILGLVKRISTLDAAKKIGEHFPEIGDRLTNTLQLETTTNNELVLASINQKINTIDPFPFKEAVSFENLTKVSKWALIPLLFVILIGSINPNILTSGTDRIVNYNEEFAPDNPFTFEIINNDLSAFRNENYDLKIKFSSDEIPKDIYLTHNNQSLRFKKAENNTFLFQFRNIQNTVLFNIKTDDFISENYKLRLIEKPVLSNISIQANFPKYIGKANKTITKTGDLIVPEGTKLYWEIRTKATKSLQIAFNDTTLSINPTNDLVSFKKQIFNSTKYSLNATNENTKNEEPLSYSIAVVKDAYPEIKIKNYYDSINPLMLYHSGVVSDDYGIKSLYFCFNSRDTSGRFKIPIKSLALQQNFNHTINLNDLQLKKGDELTYYFEIFDNDGVNGSKSTKSVTQLYRLPSKKDIEALLDENSENIKDQLSSNLNKAKELQKEFDEIKKMLLEKPKMDWNDKEKVEQFLKNQKELEKDIEKLNFENQKNNFQRKQLSPQEEEIIQKQEQINKLFEQLMDEETKKLYEELERLMEEMNKDETKDVLEKIDLSNEELEKELDRTLELYKQMEFEQKLDESIKKLEELSKKQEELAEETKENKDAKPEELSKKQEELNKEFEDIQKNIEELKEKNKELEKKRPMDDMKDQQASIKENQEKSKRELDQNKKKKSSKSQEKAAEQMKKMAEDMKKMKQEMEAEQQMEDINSLRQILENLISLSVDQEELMQTFKKTNRYDPQFVTLSKKQGDLKAGAKIIEDSLLALSKRQIALESIINREVLEINYNMNKAIDYLRERQIAPANQNQQLIMTSANNLALILDESLQNMQNQMKSKQAGNSSCNKPGNKPSGMKSAKEMQKQLNKQIQQMKKDMEGGKQKGKKGKDGMAKGFAKMAAEQNAIKEQLRKINENQKKQGKGGMGELENLQNQMEETERDILNKNITRETIKRQEDIMTKLLEADKALREREFDDKRESKQGKKTFDRNPKDFSPYQFLELDQEDQLKTVPPTFNLYYKRKINEYFNTFDE